MHFLTQGLYRFAGGFVRLCCLILSGLFFVGGFLYTCYSLDMSSQLVLTAWDNPLVSLPLLALVLFCFLFLGGFLTKNPPRWNRLLLLLVMGWCAALGILLVLFGKTVPAADAMSVYSAAERLAAGDTSVIHPTDSYLSYYPQQVGLMAFLELLIRLWRLLPIDYPAYHIIKILYVFLACLIILFQYKTVRLLWKDEFADSMYLLLAGCNLPFIMYTSFVYGEIPSFCAFSMGLYCLLWCLKGESPALFSPKGICSLVLLALSVMLRKNSLILIIAVLLVLAWQWLGSGRRSLLIFGLLAGICSFAILPAVQGIYEVRSGSHLSSGVPATAYFAMGMQESSRGNGWYNGFNFYTYQESGLDTELTVSISKAAIKDRLAFFRDHPAYAADFYLRKHLSQWADGTYACRQATLATFGGRTPFFDSLYAGDFSHWLIAYCNTYQNLLYLGAFLFCLSSLGVKSRGPRTGEAQDPGPVYAPADYLGFVGVIGGFLFHIIWEANSRYIFVYSLLLLPYAARGISVLRLWIPQKGGRHVPQK